MYCGAASRAARPTPTRREELRLSLPPPHRAGRRVCLCVAGAPPDGRLGKQLASSGGCLSTAGLEPSQSQRFRSNSIRELLSDQGVSDPRASEYGLRSTDKKLGVHTGTAGDPICFDIDILKERLLTDVPNNGCPINYS